MAAPAVTYTFSNSTTADASQVNQNFTDIINGVSDGTKDLSISALTCAGNVTFNGNTTIGNNSADDLTVTASLASTVSIKTTNSYNVGSSTKGLQYIYLGQGGGANTTRLGSSTLTSDVTISFGTVSGVVDLIPDTITIANSDSPYTALYSIPVVFCNTTSGAITVTLPTAVGNEGKSFVIKKTASDSNLVTIGTTSSQLIDGASTATLHVQYDSITVTSTNANWLITAREIATKQVSSSSSSLSSYSATAGDWTDLTSISVTPGLWDFDITTVWESNGATTTTNVECGLSTTSGNSTTGLSYGDTRVITAKSTTSGLWNNLQLRKQAVSVASTTTYYLKATAASSITNLRYAYKIEATRRK